MVRLAVTKGIVEDSALCGMEEPLWYVLQANNTVTILCSLFHPVDLRLQIH